MDGQKLDLTALRDATASLDRALQTYAAIVAVDPQALQTLGVPEIQETVRAGVVKNFEFVYELGTKMMRRYVHMEAEVPDEVAQWGFRNLLRHMADRGLIDTVEAWFGYRTMRSITARAYEPEKARTVCETAHALLRDTKALIAQLALRAEGTESALAQQ